MILPPYFKDYFPASKILIPLFYQALTIVAIFKYIHLQYYLKILSLPYVYITSFVNVLLLLFTGIVKSAIL